MLRLLLLILVFAPTILCAQTIDSLRQVAAQSDLSTEKRIAVYVDLGFAYWQVDADSALWYGEEVLKLATDIEQQKGQMEGHNIKGIAYWAKGNYPEAIDAYRKGLAIAQSDTAFAYAIPSLLTNIGICFKEIGSYDKALDNYLNALSLVKNNPVTYASTLNNIGLIYQELHQYDKALSYHQQALAVADTFTRYPRVKVSIRNNIGNVHFHQKAWTKAEASFLQALEEARAVGAKGAEADALNNLGVLAQERQQWAEAREYTLASLRLAEETGQKVEVGRALLRLAKIERETDKLWNARYFADSALSIGKRHDQLSLQRNANQELAQVYEGLRYGMKALEYYKAFDQLSDSLLSEKKTQQIQEIEAAYALRNIEAENEQLAELAALREAQVEREKRRSGWLAIGVVVLAGLAIATIILLLMVRKSLAQQRKQKAELEELNAIKDQMFSIVSHDFKSPLNSLRSILNLVEEGELTDDDLKRVIPALQKELGHSSQLLENLLFWAKTQMKGIKVHANEIDLRPLIRFDEDLLLPMAEKKEIELKVDLPESLPAYADEDMIQLVIRNIMSNAIKFTPQGGTVKVNAFTEEEHWCIQVKDTGVGIPPEKKARLFEMNNNYKTRGTDNEKGSGLGLKLCKEFIEKNRGWIWVSSEEGEGTTFSFTVPKRPPLD